MLLNQQYSSRIQQKKETIIELRSEETNLSITHSLKKKSSFEPIKLSLDKLKRKYGNCIVKNGHLVLLAARDGTVNYLSPNNGFLNPSAIIYKIGKNRKGYKAKGFISPEKIGYVKTQTKAVIRLNTFPHYEWGSLNASIGQISQSPSETGEYPILLQLETNNLKISSLLRNGLTGTASIMIEEKNLFQYLYESIMKTSYHLID